LLDGAGNASTEPGGIGDGERKEREGETIEGNA
jgi:hypothetical protein